MRERGKKPVYIQIADDIKEKVRTGALMPHDPLPSQTEMARQYETSEMTMRKALALLVEDGYIHRTRKKGSFIQAVPGSGPEAARFSPVKRLYFVHRKVRADVLNQGFYLSMLTGIADTCAGFGIEFSLFDVGSKEAVPDDPALGLILFGIAEEAHPELIGAAERWKREKRRMATIQFFLPHLDIPYIAGDNLTGGYLAAQHLLALGHRRIGCIVTGKSRLDLYPEFAMRLQGYRMALGHYGIEYDPGLVMVHDEHGETEQSGYEAFVRLMALPDPPSAVFAASDFKAMGVMRAARDLQLRVPEDISVIGYDGQPVGQWTSPKLTSVDQCTAEFGRRAVEMLFRGAPDSAEAMVSPKLIIRESTGSPPTFRPGRHSAAKPVREPRPGS